MTSSALKAGQSRVRHRVWVVVDQAEGSGEVVNQGEKPETNGMTRWMMMEMAVVVGGMILSRRCFPVHQLGAYAF